MTNDTRHDTAEEQSSSQTVVGQERASAIDDERVADRGQYWWYVETDDAEPEDGLYLGDYISVSWEGALSIVGPLHSYVFPAGAWKFVFPQVERFEFIKDGEPTGRYDDENLYYDSRHMSKRGISAYNPP